jgi:hypothetical protein
MRNRRRTLVTVALVLALILWFAWLAFDQLPPSVRAMGFPGSIGANDGHDAAATRGRLAEEGASGLAQTGPAHGHNLDRGGVAPDAQSSYLSDAPDDARTEQDGKGHSSDEPSGSGVGPTAGIAAGSVVVASSAHEAGPGRSTDVSTVSDALRSGPPGDTPPQSDAPGQNQDGTAPEPGPAASSAPAHEPPRDAGQSGPLGGTTGPVVRAESAGSGSNPSPYQWDGPGSGTSGAPAGSYAPSNPIPVPVPPSLVLFGASALMLWFVSRR